MDRRVLAAENLMLCGLTDRLITQTLAEQYHVTPRMASEYVRRAREGWREEYARRLNPEPRPDPYVEHRQRLLMCLRDARGDKDRRTQLAASVRLAQLDGELLTAKRIDVAVGASYEHGPEGLAQVIAVLESAGVPIPPEVRARLLGSDS